MVSNIKIKHAQQADTSTLYQEYLHVNVDDYDYVRRRTFYSLRNRESKPKLVTEIQDDRFASIMYWDYDTQEVLYAAIGIYKSTGTHYIIGIFLIPAKRFNDQYTPNYSTAD